MSSCVDSDVHIADLAGGFLMVYQSFTGSSITCICCKLNIRPRDVIRFSLVCLLWEKYLIIGAVCLYLPSTRTCCLTVPPSLALLRVTQSGGVSLILLSPDECSVQFSRSVMSDSLRSHGLQHTRPPCPSPTPGVYPNSCPLSRWCHPTISSSVVPFSSCPQSFPASGSFQMSQLFASSGQCIGWM